MTEECTCYVDENYKLYQCSAKIHSDHHPLCVCGDKLNITIACGCHYFCEKCGKVISNSIFNVCNGIGI